MAPAKRHPPSRPAGANYCLGCELLHRANRAVGSWCANGMSIPLTRVSPISANRRDCSRRSLFILRRFPTSSTICSLRRNNTAGGRRLSRGRRGISMSHILSQKFKVPATTVSSKRLLAATIRSYSPPTAGEKMEAVICTYMKIGRDFPPCALSPTPYAVLFAATCWSRRSHPSSSKVEKSATTGNATPVASLPAPPYR